MGQRLPHIANKLKVIGNMLQPIFFTVSKETLSFGMGMMEMEAFPKQLVNKHLTTTNFLVYAAYNYKFILKGC